MTATPGPVGLADVVPLLYRADWTRLSLSADLHRRHDSRLAQRLWLARSARSRPPGLRARFAAGVHAHDPGPDAGPKVWETHGRLVIAPPGRYRFEVLAGPENHLSVCDGQSVWEVGEDRAERHGADGPEAVAEDLLWPSRLLATFSLALDGTADVSGRTTHRLVGRPRPAASRGSWNADLLDRVLVLADAELGILLRYEEVFDGQPLTVTELTGLVLDPPEAHDPAVFRPPPGIPVTESPPLFEHGVSMTGVPGRALVTAATVAAAGMGFAIRHWPRPAPKAGDSGVMPGSGGPVPPTRAVAVGGGLVNLAHGTGLPPQAFTAEVHQWLSGPALVRVISALEAHMPGALNGIFGPDALWDAVADRIPEVSHEVTLVRIAMPGRYRIDHVAGGRPGRPVTVACDGRRLWTIYRDRAVTGPARPLTDPYPALADVAWLLSGYELSSAGEAVVDGRRGFLVLADASPGGERARHGWAGLPALIGHTEVVIDASLGVALRMTTYIEGRPVICHEMRHLTAGEPDPAVFTGQVPAGMPAGHTGPLEGLNLGSPAKVAKTAAGLGLAGAAALTGWLTKRPSAPVPPRRGTRPPA